MSKPSSAVRGGGGLRVTPWNLLLFGMPFFYWAQFAFVPVGVVCVAVVYLRTRDEAVPPPDVDELDEGTAGGRAGR